MDEYTTDAFANRDEPVPLLTAPSDVEGSSSGIESSGRRTRLKSSLKSMAQDFAVDQQEKLAQSSTAKSSLQDKLFATLLQQIIPVEDVHGGGDEPVDMRSSKYVRRPAFSLPVMTNNFRRFNGRIGIVFVFQNRLIRLFTWRKPTHTLSFLATYTFICLNPYLLTALPLAVALLFIMVPAYITRHPPPPPQPTVSSTTPYSYTGPALAPARTIKPASETSKDFFRNMRDLQNSMSDFSNVHDTLVSSIAPATNFSNEILSSTIFLYLTLLTLALFITSHLLPWRLILLILGNALVISGHPTAQTYLAQLQTSSTSQPDTTTSTTTSTSNPQTLLPPHLQSLLSSLSAITLSSPLETREVEVFELQHRQRPSSPSKNAISEWTPHLFISTPYDPLSPSRISGERPRGTRFFEDVRCPEGWVFEGKKWELDLVPEEWVGKRLIVGVEFDVSNQDRATNADEEDGRELERKDSVNADFGGWVWDLPPEYGKSGVREEEVWLAYGEYVPPDSEKTKEEKRRKVIEAERKGKDWEEGVRFGAGERTGEWRRRRWVRVVRRGVGG